MITEKRTKELHRLWEKSWRIKNDDFIDDLTEEEYELVRKWDEEKMAAEDAEHEAFISQPLPEIELDEEMRGKIERFADREGKKISSKFQRFASAVEKTDFYALDLSDRYAVRNKITHLAEVYGLRWMKLDSAHDFWSYQVNFKLQKDIFTMFSVGSDFDYFDYPSADLPKILPPLVIQAFRDLTFERVKENIQESLCDAIREKNYWYW